MNPDSNPFERSAYPIQGILLAILLGLVLGICMSGCRHYAYSENHHLWVMPDTKARPTKKIWYCEPAPSTMCYWINRKGERMYE